MTVFGVILVRIFPHLDWIRTSITLNTDIFHVVTFTKTKKVTSIWKFSQTSLWYKKLWIFDLYYPGSNWKRLTVWQKWIELKNCFCGMVDQRKTFSLMFSRDHCPRSWPSRISVTSRAKFEPAQNPSSGLVEWSCGVVITTTP